LLFAAVALVPSRVGWAASSGEFARTRAEARELVNKRDYAAAASRFESLLKDEETAFGPDSVELAVDLTDLGATYKKLARFAAAEPLFKRAIALIEAAGPRGNKRHLAIALNNLGDLYYSMGRYREAEEPLKTSIQIRESILEPNDVRLSFPIGNLGLTYLEEGRHLEAEEQFQRAIEITRQASAPLQEAIALDNLGYLYWAQGRLADAEKLHWLALELEEKAPNAKPEDLAITFNSLGSVLVDRGFLEEAEPILLRALNVWQGALAKDDPQLAYALTNLAQLYARQERWREAEPLLRRALTIREQQLGRDHPQTAIIVDALAELVSNLGDPITAGKLAASALEIKERALGTSHPEVAKTLAMLAHANEKHGDLVAALEFARRASEIRRDRASLMARARSPGAGAEIRNVREDYIRHVSLAEKLISDNALNRDQLLAEAFEIAQSAQASAVANAAFQAGLRTAAAAPGVAALVRERQDAIDAWRAADKRRDQLITLGAGQRSPDAERAVSDELKRLDAEIRHIDERLARDFPPFTELASPKPITLAAIKGLLGPDELLISLVIGARSSFLWAVHQGDAQLVRLDVTSDQIDREVSALRELLDPQRNPFVKPFDVARAYSLFKKTIGKAPGIGSARRILFVPDEAFLSLPLSVLVEAQAPVGADNAVVTWFARNHATTVLPSVSTISSMRRPLADRANHRPFIGIGNPVLEGVKPQAGLPSLVSLFRGPLADVAAIRELPPLPETAQELRELAKYQRASDDDLLLGPRATEKMVKTTDLARYRLVAFATHGLLAGYVKGLIEPALVFTPPIGPAKRMMACSPHPKSPA
jgi:tetratricopeptide (TPR) repeat protein